MALQRLTLLVAVTLLMMLATGRELSFDQAHDLKARLETGMRGLHFEPAHELKAQLDAEADGGLVNCWNALFELRSCTNEIIVFFLNGESHLGIDCCRAISVITHHCWPAMLVSIGFTAQEGDILRGYCDASAPPGETGASPPSLGPVAAGMVVKD